MSNELEEYGTITIHVKADKETIKEQDSELFDQFDELVADIHVALKKYKDWFTFEVEDE